MAGGSLIPPQGRGEPVGLAVLGGLLILLEGVYLAFASVPLPFEFVALAAVAVLSIVAGLVLVVLAVFYRTFGDMRGILGSMTIVVAVGDIWFGGGFWVGSVLGTIAGVLMVSLPLYS